MYVAERSCWNTRTGPDNSGNEMTDHDGPYLLGRECNQGQNLDMRTHYATYDWRCVPIRGTDVGHCTKNGFFRHLVFIGFKVKWR